MWMELYITAILNWTSLFYVEKESLFYVERASESENSGVDQIVQSQWCQKYSKCVRFLATDNKLVFGK